MRITFDEPKNIGEYITNKYYALSGKDAWKKRAEDANLWHWMVRASVRNVKPFEKPVQITFSFDDRLDCSNHSILEKMIEDGLVKAGVLKGDSRKYVKSITTKFNDDGKIYVDVEEINNDTV